MCDVFPEEVAEPQERLNLFKVRRFWPTFYGCDFVLVYVNALVVDHMA
jgi:hypothetical protein